VHVGMLTTTSERCGIASYSRAMVAVLREFADVTVESIEPGKQSDEHYHGQAERLNACDVVHIQHEYSFWGGYFPRRWSFWTLREAIERPCVVTAHTTITAAELWLPYEPRPIRRALKWLVLQHPGLRYSIETGPFATRCECIVHTEAARQSLAKRGVSLDHLHTLAAGIPTAAPAPTEGRAFRDRYGLGNKRIVSLFGYVTRNKGYELVIDTMPELPPDVVFVIAGGARIEAEAPYARELASRVEQQGLRDRVIITGFLENADVPEAMAASEIILVPHTEASGSYSVTVPLAYGKPILASDLDCFREIQQRSPCMRLFRSGDREHFAACLNALLRNPVGQAELAERALDYAREHSWRHVAQRTVEVYEKALHDWSAP
jgi:glycosyltransferase involved in cell wall biosynthesis